MTSFLSYSGGVESTTMLAMFGDRATAIFADTGWEHQVLYDRLDEVERITGHPIVRVQREGITLPDYIEQQCFAPGPRARFCTRMFKIEPIDAYLKSRVPCELMIGLNADEAGLRAGNHGLIEGVIYSYPLVDLGITRAMCVAFLRERGLLPRFPGYMKRGGCVGCFFKSKREYKAMAVESPAEADAVADLEDVIQDVRGKRYGIRDGIKNLRKFNAQVRRQTVMDLGSSDDSEGALPSPCGVFCHR